MKATNWIILASLVLAQPCGIATAQPIAGNSPVDDSYLCDIEPQSSHMHSDGGWKADMAARRKSGAKGSQIYVRGAHAPHSLGTHPFSNGNATVTYALNEKYSRFIGAAAIEDAAAEADTPLTFRIVGDDVELWKSRPIKRSRVVEGFNINVSGVKTLQIIVDCPGGFGNAHAVWVEPKLFVGPRPDAPVDLKPLGSTTTRPAQVQASVKALWVVTQGSGMMLGESSEMVLTITRGRAAKLTAVRFVTPVGSQMRLARDEAQRFIRLTFPNWNADDAEITFENKYVPHDGGSIGTALGALILSAIQGFQIDSDIAITGDISANGKVRRIGGVAAKLRGAIAGKCRLVAIPLDNEGQLVDAVTYYGPGIVLDIQVIGVSTLDNAIATLRVDRSPELKEAIELFATIQESAKGKPDALKSKEVQAKLSKVLELAPNHLSAKVLLGVAQGKQPRTLSATASKYYAFGAANPILEALHQRGDAAAQTRLVPSSTVQAGLADLRKLRPMADPAVQPLIDAFIRFISAWSAVQQGSGSVQNLERHRQALLDEMTRQEANVEMMQEMMREGV